MLKNRSKAFAPKFKGGPRRPPGNPPSSQSTRPSVEPQSQTSALDAVVENAAFLVAEEDKNEHITQKTAVDTSVQSESSHQPAEQAASSKEEALLNTPQLDTNAAENVPISNLLTSKAQNLANTSAAPSQTGTKRKSATGETLQPPAKRTAIPPSAEAITSHISLDNGLDIGSAISRAATANNETHPQVLQPNDHSTHVEITAQQRTNDELENELDNGIVGDGRQSSRSSSEAPQSPPRMRYPSPPTSNNITLPVLGSVGAQMLGLGAVGADMSGLGAAGAEMPGLGPAGGTNILMGPGQLVPGAQIIPMAGLNPDGTAAALVDESGASGTDKGKKKKKIIRRKKVQAGQVGDDSRATIDMQLNRPRRVPGQKRSRKRKDGDKKNRKRAVTPEGAEEEVIDPTELTMKDLCKDLRIGKKFSRHDVIKERQTKAKAKAKLAKLHPELAVAVEGNQPDGEEATPAPEGEDGAAGSQIINDSGLRMRVVDGQIVVDENTLQVDRQERGRAENQVLELIEEDDFTRITTSNSYRKFEKTQAWDEAADDMFYQGLRQFGTDFMMISKMFPYRSRRQIKLKFNKEEKLNPDKITRAMTGVKEPINLEEFEQYSNLKLEEVSVIEAERQQIEDQQNAEQAAHAAEVAEVTRRKKADIAQSGAAKRFLASVDDEDGYATGPGSVKENNEPDAGKGRGSKSKKATANKKKNLHSSSNGNGSEAVVMHTIEEDID